jgi:hypothetical protein
MTSVNVPLVCAGNNTSNCCELSGLTAVAVSGPPGPVRLTTSASVNVEVRIGSLKVSVIRSTGPVVFPLGEALVTRGPVASYSMLLSVLVEAWFGFPAESVATPAGMLTTTVPEPVRPVTETV